MSRLKDGGRAIIVACLGQIIGLASTILGFESADVSSALPYLAASTLTLLLSFFATRIVERREVYRAGGNRADMLRITKRMLKTSFVLLVICMGIVTLGSSTFELEVIRGFSMLAGLSMITGILYPFVEEIITHAENR